MTKIERERYFDFNRFKSDIRPFENKLNLAKTYSQHHTTRSMVTELVEKGKLQEIKESFVKLKSKYNELAEKYKNDPQFLSKQGMAEFLDQSEKEIQNIEKQLKTT